MNVKQKKGNSKQHKSQWKKQKQQQRRFYTSLYGFVPLVHFTPHDLARLQNKTKRTCIYNNGRFGAYPMRYVHILCYIITKVVRIMILSHLVCLFFESVSSLLLSLTTTTAVHWIYALLVLCLRGNTPNETYFISNNTYYCILMSISRYPKCVSSPISHFPSSHHAFCHFSLLHVFALCGCRKIASRLFSSFGPKGLTATCKMTPFMHYHVLLLFVF